jgi:predicted phosphodiesterase
MTRIGVLSDIHGNLPALEVVLAALAVEGVDRIVCCGDLVGYGPCPGGVIDRLREVGALCVQGNHDATTAEAFPLDWFNTAAGAVIEWTRSVLSQGQIAYLKGLPQTHTEERFVLVHGSLRGPLWEYMRNAFVAGESFPLFDRPLGLFGHSHIQGGFIQEGERVSSLDPTDGTIDLLPGARYLINPGSVGQPRDGDPRAAYAIVDLQEGRVRFKRVRYDVDLVTREIRRAGLPREFAERLAIGR